MPPCKTQKETGITLGLNVGMGADRIGSPLCPAVGIGIICVYPSAPYTRELALQFISINFPYY
jgi:hypothetical protein